MPRRVSIIIHMLAVAIISAIAWRYHDPAIVLAYIAGVFVEWDVNLPRPKGRSLEKLD